MDIVLLERIEKLGQMGDVVSVRPGYARNFLLPQQKALRATKENMALFEKRRAQLEAENLKQRGEAEQVATKMDGLKLVIIRQAGESGQLYGSVSARDVADELKDQGFTVDRRQVALDQTIKTLGLHPVRVRLHPEVIVTVTANISRSEEESEMQEKQGRMVSIEDQRRAVEAAEAEIEKAVEEALETAESEESEETPAEDTEETGDSR